MKEKTQSQPDAALSGIYALDDGREAFAARVQLVRIAEHSIDAQYYIWHYDTTGSILFAELFAAAQRGVKIRLLLDDNNTAGLDDQLMTLSEHPNIEVKIFNPFRYRRLRILGLVTDFFRLNRRMHNKSITADRLVTIVGGRNIGDQYFGAADDFTFADADVIAVGPVVDSVKADFEKYWTSRAAFPVERLLPGPKEAFDLFERKPRADEYMSLVGATDFARAVRRGDLPLQWVPARLLSDDPRKIHDKAPLEHQIFYHLQNIMKSARTKLDLASAYFVPARIGTKLLIGLARKGVRVRVLTNSLSATDVVIVHSGYSKKRKELLKAGVQLFEMPHLPFEPQREGVRARFGSSRSSLHSKTFSVDGRRVFIGSFNFDPRSARLNTEMGIIMESSALAQHIESSFDTEVPATAYELRLTTKGRISWIERKDGGEIVHTREPGTRLWQRAVVWLLSKLPIDWLL